MRRPSALLALLTSLSLVLPAAAANGDRGGNGHGNAYGHADRGQRGNNGNGNVSRNAGGNAPASTPANASPNTGGNASGNARGNGNGNGSGHGNGNGRGNKGRSNQASTLLAAPTTASPDATRAPEASAAAAPTAAPAASTPAPTPPAVTAPAPARSNPPRASRGRRTTSRSTRARHARAVAGKPAARPATPASRPVVATAPGAAAPAKPRQASRPHSAAPHEPPTVVRTLRRVVERIPAFVKALIVVLGSLLLLSSLAWALLARTARYLRRQRAHLLGEIGVLQGALLPNVPAELSRLQASVAYRPAEGLAAGGDFYDAFPLDDGRVGIVVGDVAGHGREALMHTSLLRYTLRAYLEADLEPRVALQLAGRALDRGFDTLATVVLAVYDPARHVLRYASAGHPPPVFLGEADHVPVTQASAPPIGAGVPTGVRQTTVSLPSGSAVCFFTDGLIEARRGDAMIGRLGLVDIIRELGPDATADQLLERISRDADQVSDDMAACMFRVSDGPNEAYLPRVEEIEVTRDEPLEATLGRFLDACGLDAAAIDDTTARAKRTVRQFRGAVVRVSLPRGGPRVEVRPANVDSLARARAA